MPSIQVKSSRKSRRNNKTKRRKQRKNKKELIETIPKRNTDLGKLDLNIWKIIIFFCRPLEQILMAQTCYVFRSLFTDDKQWFYAIYHLGALQMTKHLVSKNHVESYIKPDPEFYQNTIFDKLCNLVTYNIFGQIIDYLRIHKMYFIDGMKSPGMMKCNNYNYGTRINIRIFQNYSDIFDYYWEEKSYLPIPFIKKYTMMIDFETFIDLVRFTYNRNIIDVPFDNIDSYIVEDLQRFWYKFLKFVGDYYHDTTNNPNFNNLTDDILINIISYLNLNSFKTFSRINKRCHSISKEKFNRKYNIVIMKFNGHKYNRSIIYQIISGLIEKYTLVNRRSYEINSICNDLEDEFTEALWNNKGQDPKFIKHMVSGITGINDNIFTKELFYKMTGLIINNIFDIFDIFSKRHCDNENMELSDKSKQWWLNGKLHHFSS